MADPVPPPADSDDEKASRLLLAELARRRNDLAGSAHLPPEDKALSERILAEARRRSAQLSGAASDAAPSPAAEGIPWWLWLGWIAAIAATVLAFRYLT